jgi:hypothetical protein
MGLVRIGSYVLNTDAIKEIEDHRNLSAGRRAKMRSVDAASDDIIVRFLGGTSEPIAEEDRDAFRRFLASLPGPDSPRPTPASP